MKLNTLVARLKSKFIDEFERKPFRPCRVFLAATDMKSRAIVRQASDVDPNVAFNRAIEQLTNAIGTIEPTILRADWIINAEAMTWEQLLRLIGRTRRNYFRRGIALSPDFSVAFTETELNANLMFYSDSKMVSEFNRKRANIYCQARFGHDFPTLKPGDPVVVFDTNGAFIIDGEEPQSITGVGVNAGHRDVPPPDSDLLMQLMRNGTHYIALGVSRDEMGGGCSLMAGAHTPIRSFHHTMH